MNDKITANMLWRLRRRGLLPGPGAEYHTPELKHLAETIRNAQNAAHSADLRLEDLYDQERRETED